MASKVPRLMPVAAAGRGKYSRVGSFGEGRGRHKVKSVLSLDKPVQKNSADSDRRRLALVISIAQAGLKFAFTGAPD